MFYVDKYRPNKIEDAIENALINGYFHLDELLKLQKMSKDDAIPHLIFFGPEGSGKKTIINLLLEMLFDKHVHELCDSVYNVIGSGNTVNQVTVKQSNYHIVIEPTNTNFDRYLIQDVVKEYAKKIPLNIFTAKRTFKIVLINNIDNLSYYAQTSLRRTLELYSSTCRFIMWSRSLSKVIDPLRSRCFCFCIKSPTDDQLMNFLLDVSAKEKIKLSMGQYSNILDIAKGNIKTATWLLHLYKLDEPIETTYDISIKEIIESLLKKDCDVILNIRNSLYNIMITNVPGTYVVRDILQKLLLTDKISYESKISIANYAAICERNLIKCRREMTQLEPFISSIIKTLIEEK